MRSYIYPDNLRAEVKLWFWNIRDFLIICGGVILSAVVFAKLWNVIPFAMTACFAFLTIRAEDNAIVDYVFNAVKFFCISQQTYRWKKE